MTEVRITARYMRRRCPVQYEHIEAEVELGGVVADADGSVEGATAVLLNIAQSSVHAALTGKPVQVDTIVSTGKNGVTEKTETVKAEQPVATEAPKNKPGRPKKEESKPAPAAAAPDAGAFPGTEPAPAAPTEPAPAEVDEFAGVAPAEPEAKVLTPQELQQWLASMVTGKDNKITVIDVKAEIAKYDHIDGKGGKAVKTDDTKPEDRAKIKAGIQELSASRKKG